MNVIYGIQALSKQLAKIKPSKVVIVVPKNIRKLHSRIIEEIESVSKSNHLIPVEDGEGLKSWNSIEKILNTFLKLKLDRKSLVIAVGGGTVGDSIGFASSVYLRGIPYINIPTTLLAQVDSAHGGKTGINFGSFKNQIGTFHESIATVIEPRFIETLPKEEIVSGLGEIIKAGYLRDKTILSLLQKETVQTISQSKNIQAIIKKSIEVKRYCALNDLHDKGIRQLLNVGHTISHAIEIKHQLSHGRAVLVGMLEEFRMSETADFSKKGLEASLKTLLDNMDINLDKKYAPDWKAVEQDKKVSSESLEWPIVTEIGKSKIVKVSLKNFKELYFR